MPNAPGNTAPSQRPRYPGASFAELGVAMPPPVYNRAFARLNAGERRAVLDRVCQGVWVEAAKVGTWWTSPAAPRSSAGIQVVTSASLAALLQSFRACAAKPDWRGAPVLMGAHDGPVGGYARAAQIQGESLLVDVRWNDTGRKLLRANAGLYSGQSPSLHSVRDVNGLWHAYAIAHLAIVPDPHMQELRYLCDPATYGWSFTTRARQNAARAAKAQTGGSLADRFARFRKRADAKPNARVMARIGPGLPLTYHRDTAETAEATARGVTTTRHVTVAANDHEGFREKPQRPEGMAQD